MSIIFGVKRTEGQTIEKRELLSLAQSTQKYAPDGTSIYTQAHLGMGYQPYHTHERSSLEALPIVDAHSNVLSFDGRLDNYAELSDLLDEREAAVPDSRIVLKAFERWGEDCFSHLIGDWALALWAHSERALYLARDHAGSRSLYFEHSSGRIVWSTYLETFFTNGRTHDLDQDFAALYLACRPTRELTPYKGVKAVPPAHYLKFREGEARSKPHWQAIMAHSVVYATDVEYEEHFFQLFRQSVQRRTVPGAPILAELSGGMDSSSIVCMSDHIRRSQYPLVEPLDTVSYYDNSEPDWDEFPFFSVVERSRGKMGLHLNASYSERTIRPQHSNAPMQLWPGTDSSGTDLEARLHDALVGRNIRSLLSGLGGDEVLGGIPNPYPELGDFMIKGNLLSLSRSGIEWSLANRMPFVHLILETLRFTSRLYFTGPSTPQQAPPWLSQKLLHRSASGTAEATVWDRLRWGLPSLIDNGNAWWSVLEGLPHRLLSNKERFEYRYPYLDRNLVEFLFSIPTRQLVEPGRRRSLMRRALKHIVPQEILERRRKAYLIRGPINLIRREHDWLATQFKRLLCAEIGLVDPSSLPTALKSVAIEGNPEWMPFLMRLISFELWLGTAPVCIPSPFPQRVANKIRIKWPFTGTHDSEI
jgi:asparagine synthase (glutamine-hydrolysing)